MFERSTISQTILYIYIYIFRIYVFDLGGWLWFPDFIFHNYLATTSILWMDWVNHGQLWQAGRAEFRGLAPHGSGKCCVSPSRPLASERLGASRRHPKIPWGKTHGFLTKSFPKLTPLRQTTCRKQVSSGLKYNDAGYILHKKLQVRCPSDERSISASCWHLILFRCDRG